MMNLKRIGMKSGSMNLSLALALGLALTAVAGQARASSCSQTGHWHFPVDSQAIEFGASIGNHEGVRVKYFYDREGGSNVVQVTRSGFADRTSYEFREKTGIIAVQTSGSFEAKSWYTDGDAKYVPMLTKMRDLIGYAGAPERYFWPIGGSQVITPGAIHIVKYLDDRIAAASAAAVPANCILYKESFPETPTQACNLTAGPLFTLGPWESQVRSVWVREGYQLTLIKDQDFSPEAGYETFSGDDAATPLLGEGRLFTVSQDAGLDAKSALCVSKNP